MDETSVKKVLLKKLTIGLAGKLFRVQPDVRLSMLFAKIIYADIVVYDVDEKPLAVFEVKRYPQAWTIRKQLDSSLSRTFETQGVRYSVLIDGDDFWMWSQESREYLKTDFDNVLKTLKNGLPVLGPAPSAEEISSAIVDAATKENLKQCNSVFLW